MGTENPNRPIFHARPMASPFAAPSQTRPILSSGPMTGSEVSLSRPVTPPLTSTPFSSQPPVTGPYNARFSGPTPLIGAVPRFPSPPVGFTPPPTSLRPGNLGQPTITPPQPLAGQGPPPPYPLQSKPPALPMGSPPQTVNYPSSAGNVTPVMLGQPTQPSMPGYPALSNVGPQPPPLQSPFTSQPRSYGQPQPRQSFPVNKIGHSPPPPLSTPYGMPPITGPPTGSIQGLVEDFNSLSVGSVPGSMDPGLDPKNLPRPLEGDVEPHAFAESYPMNCDSRYLRLTTSAIPSSQSLASRWHLPLGAVVCPLAEAPKGVSNLHISWILRRKSNYYSSLFLLYTKH